MRMKSKRISNRIVLMVFGFFLLLFFWTAFSGDAFPEKKRNSYLLYLGIGNVFLLLSLLRDWKKTRSD
jgi:hypothetical protein